MANSLFMHHHVQTGDNAAMSTSTFGYHAAQDRIWLSHSGWQERVWLTRRQVQGIIKALAQTLEQSAPGEGDGAARAALEHDVSINRPAAGATAKTLQVGRDTPARAADAAYVLCTGMVVMTSSEHVHVQLHVDGGQRTITFDRKGVHRWLRALYLVVKQADWGLPHLPQWLTRSYLPPALQNILDAPIGDLGEDGEEDDPSI